MQKLRKIFTVSVMIVTVLSMCVVVAPGANAAASAGSLIKMDGNQSVYYLGADGKRYVFPNEATYMSWYSDFSGVVTIPQSELESYPLGANVVMRAGTKLAKITTDPKVYAVLPNGKLLWIPSEDVAKTLYGNDWAKRVVDVPDAFFTNYTVQSGQASSTAYPAGSLIKTATASDIYYINADGTASKIANESTLASNRFKSSDIITTSLAIPTLGTELSSALYTDTSQGGGAGTGITPGAGTGLTVALASDNPVATSILADSSTNEYPQALISFAKANFTASSDGAVKVTTVKFTRTGIAADTDLGNLYLYDGDTKLAEYTSFSSKVVTFSNSAGLFTVDAGTTKTVTLKGDLARGSTSVTSGKTISFAVNSAADITTNGAAVSGSFPLSGNTMTTASVSDLGHLYFAGAAGSNGTIPATVKADEANKELWSVNVTADAQNMQIKYLKFTMVGTIATTDIDNIRLEVAGVQVGSAVAMGSDKTVVFDLSSAPITINSGVTKAIALRGDMKGGSGRVFKFTVQRSSDVVLYDTNYGVFVTPNVNNTTTAFGVVQQTTGNGTSVDAGTLTVGVATDSPTGNVAKGGTGLTLAKFSFGAAGEAVKIDNLTVYCTSNDAANTLKNFKVLLDGSQVGTTDSTITCDNGTDTTNFTFSNTFVINTGTTRYLTVVADTTDTNITAADTLAVKLSAGSGNAMGQVTMTTLSTTAQTARTLTVKSGTAAVVKNTAFADRSSTSPTGTVSAAAAKIASFIITAGGGEAINVTQIKLADDATTELGDNFQNLKLMNGTTQIGSTISSLNTTAGTYTFTPSTSIQIAAGQQYVVDVYADIKSAAADTATVLNPVCAFDKVTATGVNTGTDASYDSNQDLQKAYVSAQGNLTVTLDSDSALSQQMLMGSTGIELAKFKFAADATEDITISKIALNDLLTAASTGSIKNLKVYDGTTQIGQTVNFTTAYGTTTYAILDGLNLTIPRNSNKILTVKGDLTSYDEGGISASTHRISIYPTYDGTNEPITAVGAASGQSITGAYLDISSTTDAEVKGNTMAIYKALISVAWASDTPSGAVGGGSAYTVAKVNIVNATNVGNYSATVKNLNFAISQTGISNTADRQLKVYKDAISAGNLLATTQWIGTGTENFGNTAIAAGDFVDVEISSGATKTFIVTMDTNDAGTNDRLSIYVDTADVDWYDGVSDIAAVNTLPLSPKT
ncbi:MAG: hypothetical protein PHT51_03070, partial [Patescibacteria group bacterium]|nr:hypothetical protein [Patescibacteria group bacterium]